jgi:hypothetical protein
MFFRFGSALILVVVTSLLGILVEKQNLQLRRELSRQHYRMDVLQEEHARLRLRSQQLAAVERLFATVEAEESGLVPSQPGSTARQSAAGKSAVGQSEGNSSPAAGTIDAGSHERNSLDMKTRRAPLLFWRKPVGDPRVNRGQQ